MAINKEYLGKGLNAVDLLIFSQVEEFNRNGFDCYMTDEQFMDITGATLYKVRKSLDRLENMNIIERDTKTISGNGKANKRRTIYLKKNYHDAILKNDICYVDNQQTINNIINKKINLEEQSSSRTTCKSNRYY